MDESANKIIAKVVILFAAAYSTYRLLTYKDMQFDERIPTAAGGINNPGNIEKPNGRSTFRGEIVLQDGSRFTSFKTMAHGYRAIKRILQTKYSHGLTSLRQMISSYAPAEDNNDVGAYVNFVSAAANVDPDKDMNEYSNNVWEDVVKAIGVHEQGQAWLAQYGANNSTWVHDGFLMV